MLKGKKVFVSGGAGVIGTELVHKLVNAGADVFIGDLKPRPPHLPASVRYRQGDLNEISKEELAEFSPEYFFHLAATFERSEETYEFWEENYRHNLKLSHHLMDLLKDIGSLQRVVFASSYLIYNPDQYQFEQPAKEASPLTESSPLHPRNLCGAAKLMHEIELRFLQHFAGERLKTVSARIYRVYGKNSRDIVSRWIRALLNQETIQVYRKEGMFDYIYAGDVAEGLLRLALSDATGIVNLGNGRSRRVEDVLNILKLHFPDMQHVEMDSDIPFEASEAEMSTFKAWTGWHPNRQLEDTIPELISHYKALMSSSSVDPEQSHRRNGVLVTSVARKVPLLKCVSGGITKLGEPLQLIGGDVNEQAIGRYFVDRFWTMPYLKKLSTEQLLKECQQQGIRYIIPTRDGELAYFAEAKKELARHGVHVMVSDAEAVQICLDKQLFYRKGVEWGFPVIVTGEQIEEVQSANSMYVVKERFGAGSQSIGIQLSLEDANKHAQSLEQPIFQPYIFGFEVSVDVYVQQNGKCKGVVARKRELVIGGESQITTTFRHEELEQMCAAFAEKLGLYGHAVFQAIIDEQGGIHFIECNSRFGGASRLSVAAGLDTFYWFLLESDGANLDEYPFIRSEHEKRLVRYAEDLIQ